jgi:hypothetical protein
MSNRSANVLAIAISGGSGSLPGLMFLALRTFFCVATITRSAGEDNCCQQIAHERAMGNPRAMLTAAKTPKA